MTRPHPGSLFDSEAFFSRPLRDAPLLVLGGLCVLESHETCLEVGETLRDACLEAGFSYLFKASFDKANRSSISGFRGPGLEKGCDQLARLRDALSVPVVTDIHEASQAARAAQSVDMLQIPAFLCRQTDLLAAAAMTGKPVNVKKGQFMAPSEMVNALSKLKEGGCTRAMLTERGTFFGYNRLVNDFTAIADMQALGTRVCFDVTHSTQLPGAEGSSSGGRPERAELLARAAVAAGTDAIFLECHPEPARALSDASTSLKLSSVRSLLLTLARIRAAIRT
ncbi:MAG: 3-deoxy-8-phosphooctulonate synthase [Phycisphaerales bacterium]|nr:3-deoxy-8-phosphooctulonate synthase [Phycisphaerales bacterium]